MKCCIDVYHYVLFVRETSNPFPNFPLVLSNTNSSFGVGQDEFYGCPLSRIKNECSERHNVDAEVRGSGNTNKFNLNSIRQSYNYTI